MSSELRYFTPDELDDLGVLDIACPNCGHARDWLVTQNASGHLLAECNECWNATIRVPVETAERLVSA